MIKTRKIVLPGMAKSTTTSYNPENYNKESRMAGVVYGKGDQKIKQIKTTVKELPGKTIIKTTKYGPANYYGKQTKTKTKQVIKK